MNPFPFRDALPSRPTALYRLCGLLGMALLAACASLPPGTDFPKARSSALAHPEQTPMGRQVALAARGHGGDSGFRLLSKGLDGFLARMQMARAATRTLDLQYFIFRADETGKLLTDAVLRAADRGVRVRILVDDGDPGVDDAKLAALDSHPEIELRVFNPFAYRGPSPIWRSVEFMFEKSRLDYRMHNKLMVVDNSIALLGGRNIGDEYFQVDPVFQFGDGDILAAGPIVRQLSTTFDAFWNSASAIPVRALAPEAASAGALAAFRKTLLEHRRQLEAGVAHDANRLVGDEPLGAIVDGRSPLVWAPARLVYDLPDKQQVVKRGMRNLLMQRDVANAVATVRSELLIITPYFVPGEEGMRLFDDLRKRGVAIRVVTNSLESTTVLAAQSGYMRYRLPMLERGIEIHEVRSRLGDARGSGESPRVARDGNFSLHAKIFVLDRERLFIGSMNFDQRSIYLNTEIGLIIDSPELARQAAARFEAMAQPANSYALALRPGDKGGPPHLVWHTEEKGRAVEYASDPARSLGQRLKVTLWSMLPLDREL